jgi:pimeloyl-ACP methyl ester carboxylesterase
MEYYLRKGRLPELIIVFSPVNIPTGKFGFSRYLKNEARHILFFNCENTWYVDCIDEMHSIVLQVIEELTPEHVVFYGASMGGYAAMRIGGLFPEYPSFIFGSEIKLYIPGSLSQKQATIKMDNVDLTGFEELDFSNTVALFGIYEPIDLIQYKISLDLGFHSTIPVRSPHAVHEELYYRELSEKLTQSRTCEEFVNNIPINFYDENTPLEQADSLYQMFFNYKLNNSKEKLELIQNINHPTAYWVLLKTVLYTKKSSELNKIEKNLIRYFEEESEGYSMPAKFPKQISSIRKKLFNDKESIDH